MGTTGQSHSGTRSQHQRSSSTTAAAASRRLKPKQQQWRRSAGQQNGDSNSRGKWGGPCPPCPHCCGRGRLKTNHPEDACFSAHLNIAAKRGEGYRQTSPKCLQQKAKPMGYAYAGSSSSYKNHKIKGPNGPRVWALKMTKGHTKNNNNNKALRIKPLRIKANVLKVLAIRMAKGHTK